MLDRFTWTGGTVPVVTVDADPVHRMMSTVRHNRARGTHAVLRMAEIVRSMADSGLSADEICTQLGMEYEELERLLDRSGMTVRGTAGVSGFGRAWVPGRKG
jgi:ParB-like chromosome segregation protein Spo0J